MFNFSFHKYEIGINIHTNNTNSKYETTTTTIRAEQINTKHSQHNVVQTIPRKQHDYRGNEKLKGVRVT